MQPIKSVKSIQSKPFPEFTPKRRVRGRHICAVVLLVIAAIMLQSSLSGRNEQTPSIPKPDLNYPDFFAVREEYLSQFKTLNHVVQQGDTLSQVFQKLGLPTECVAQWQKSCSDFCNMSQLQPGDSLSVQVSNEDQQPVRFVFSSLSGTTYTFHKMKKGWECNQDVTRPSTVTDAAAGTITDSLYDSCLRAGLTPGLVMELADLFAYDIDFNTEIQEGDTFGVYFEEQVKDGKRVRAGPVLGAEMVTSGTRYQAFFYQLSDGYKGYFDAEGKALRKLFLRAPLSYSRISSTFSYRRFHPILRTFRPHLGIDYSAPAGVPVSALGDGVVTFMGKKGGFGRFVEIRHGGTYKTTYGHLMDFAKGLRTGSRVAQGDVIGHVGSSGLSTGPHLDFRFYKDGKPVDFLKTEFPRARTVPKALWGDFEQRRDHCLAALRGVSPVQERKPVKTAANE